MTTPIDTITYEQIAQVELRARKLRAEAFRDAFLAAGRFFAAAPRAVLNTLRVAPAPKAA